MFSIGMPRSTSRLRHASDAAPAPEATSFTSLMLLPTTFRPFVTAAATTIAVPCWSSWKTGIFMRLRHSRSTMKQSGALMSSRLMPAEGRLERRDHLDQLVRVRLVQLDVEHVDTSELLEQH